MNHGYMQVISNLDNPIITGFIILVRLSRDFPPSEHSISRQCEDIHYHKTTFASTCHIVIFLPSMHCTANDLPSTCQCPSHFLSCPECCPSLIHRQGLNACFRLRAKPCVCATLAVFVYPESVRYCMHLPLPHPTNRYPLLCRLRAGGGYVHLRALLFGVRFSDTTETVEHIRIVLRFDTTWTRSLRRSI